MNERLKFDLEKIGENSYILGIDEVGWGCVAGSLVLGGSLVPKKVLEENKYPFLDDVKDSKKLSEKKRKLLIENLNNQNEILFCVGEADVKMINEHGLAYAYSHCIDQILHNFNNYLNNSKILIDGNRDPKTKIITNFELVVKGDDKSIAIGIASNIAKEYRDNQMIELSKVYPMYDWENNVGYGTKTHTDGLKKHKLSPYHRTKSSEKLIKPD